MTRRQLRFVGSCLGILLGLGVSCFAFERLIDVFWAALVWIVAAALIVMSSERRYTRRRMKRGY